MKYQATKKRRNVQCCACGLLLAFWLSLPTAVFAKGEGIQASKEPAAPTDVPITTVAPSIKADSAALSDTALTVTKTDVQLAVDYAYLRMVAPGSIAWLYQPNTTINQPVMLSDNPEYYLRRRFDGRISQNGSMFMLGTEMPRFSAPVVSLYGVNCLDFSLFGSLSNYQESAYYEANPTLYLLTPQGDYQLDIFAGIRTKFSDSQTGKITQKSTKALWAEDLPVILQNSFLKPNPAFLPTEGDAWAVLATESYRNQGVNRYVIYARKRPIEYRVARVAYVNELEMDSRTTLNGRVSVAGVGEWMLYAQNDPLWTKLVYEAEGARRKRSFGGGGCGPTAAAMAIVNLVEEKELGKLGSFASSPVGFRFCTCSVNDFKCSGRHLPYQITTSEEYLRYFPLAVASFATGNNIWGVQGRGARFGTSMRYLEDLCQVYDISVTQTYQMEETLEFLKSKNTKAIACTSGYGSPFTKTSHFVVLAGVDQEYLYVLDPLRRDHYLGTDEKSYLEVIVPGLVRIKLENATQCNLSPIYLLQRNQGQAEPSPVLQSAPSQKP